LGRDALLFVWLSSLGFSSGGILRSRLRCSEGGFGLWLGDEDIVVVKRAHHLIYSNTNIYGKYMTTNLKEGIKEMGKMEHVTYRLGYGHVTHIKDPQQYNFAQE
jgi:hypothetical protein